MTTRSIVLRFASTCYDCGADLKAGTTARWFGKGRVSCCGGSDRAPAAKPAAPPAPIPAPVLAKPAPAPAPVPKIAATATAAPASSPWPAGLLQLARETGVPVDSLAAGLTPADVATLAVARPMLRLLVRLSSGARVIVPAQYAQHVISCISESLMDRVRDVAVLAGETAGG
jgi:hypothetical protein